MNVKLLSEKLLIFVRKNYIVAALGLLGLIFFSYGLIALLVSSKTNQGDIVFEAGADSLDTKTTSTSGINAKDASLAIDIEGAVVSPGVYNLPLGARVKDALIIAGGLSSDADRDWITKNLNLAAKLADGEKIYLPRIGDSIQGLASVPNDGKISVNSASREELDSLPGVGPTTADKIIRLRPYSDVNELLSKKAISNKVFEQIKDKIRVY